MERRTDLLQNASVGRQRLASAGERIFRRRFSDRFDPRLGAGFLARGAGRDAGRGGARRGAGSADVAAAGACAAGGHLGGGDVRREILSVSSSSSWSHSLNFPTSLSPTFHLPRRHSLGAPGEHQPGSNARACGLRLLRMWARKPGAKGSSPCKVGGLAGATVGEGLFGAPVVHSWLRLWDHAGCILGTGALLQTMRPHRGLHSGCGLGALVAALCSCPTEAGAPGHLAPPSSALAAGERPAAGAC